MAKKKEIKPIPMWLGIIMILLAFVAMGLLLSYIFAPPESEVSHIDDLGEQSFREETSVEAPAPVEVKEYMSDANVGDAVYYGKYEQDGNLENGPEAIQWVVLKKDDTGLLLISRYCLDSLPYNEKRDYVNWESSTLRAWLNGDFYSNAFNETEKPNLIGMGETASLVDSNVEFVDKVSILSSSSALDYAKWLPTSATEYAVSQGVETQNGNSWWWVRESNEERFNNETTAKYVYFDGSIKEQGFAVDYNKVGVRPVILVSINAEKEDLDVSNSAVEPEESSEIIYSGDVTTTE